MLFTDELRFCLSSGDGRICVYRRSNERYTEACTLERDRFGGGGSIMVWGGVSQHHQTKLVVIAGDLNAVCYRALRFFCYRAFLFLLSLHIYIYFTVTCCCQLSGSEGACFCSHLLKWSEPKPHKNNTRPYGTQGLC